MPKVMPTPERLFDRTWRPGSPFRPRAAYLRRIILYIVLAALMAVIGAYLVLTDSARVKRMAEEDLGKLLGGRVEVKRAHLSIFQGLRLDEVSLSLPDSTSAQSKLFTADSFLIEYNPLGLLRRQIDATRIIVVTPEVHLWEDPQTHKSNLSRWLESRQANPLEPSGPGGRISLPEIVLRNAKVRYTRVGADQLEQTSTMAIEGVFRQRAETDSYAFTFQSRGHSSELGPMVEGQLSADGQVTARLQNFEFGEDLKAMLPWEVKQWSEQHRLEGRLNVPALTYTAGKDGGKSGFFVEIRLEGVKLEVDPELWIGQEGRPDAAALSRAFGALRHAGLDRRRFVTSMAELVEPERITLNNVVGKFTFSSDEVIKIEDLHGRLEDIPFTVSGRINGYTPDATADIHITSPKLKYIEIPAAPKYLDSLPDAVREIYRRFKPRGVCGFAVNLVRGVPGGRPHVTGHIEIIDGNFTFEKFAYPMRKTTGKILLKFDPKTQQDILELDRIQGRGLVGGPNENAIVTIEGKIQSFGPDGEVDVTVSGQAVQSEPALLAAFPDVTRKALATFDAPGKGELPRFGGDFICRIMRNFSRESKWIIQTNIHLDDASGALVAFPYPMKGVSGDLRIHEDHVELVDISMKKGDSNLRIDGKIWWPRDDAPVEPGVPLLRPNLVISARNVPIDRDLLAALPEAQRLWLQRIGAGGRFDLEGTIKPADGAAITDELRYDLHITLRDGTLWPIDGTFAVSDVQGNLRLKNQRLIFSELRGRRGAAELMARGEISWPNDKPGVVLQAEARDLSLDAPLHKLLPEAAQAAWDQVRPEGTVDVSLTYSGGVADPADNPPAGRAQADGYELVITPRKLSVTPAALPYRLDELTGSMRIIPDRVELRALSGRHGTANLRFAGTGTTGRAGVWNFTLSGESVPVDDDLLAAAPQPLADLLKSLQMKGKIAFDFEKLKLATPSEPGNAASDVDFAVKLRSEDASLDVGVPLDDVKGMLSLTGASRKGKLANLEGKLDLDSLTLAGRTATAFSARLNKPAGKDQLAISEMKATLARGSMAGQVDYWFPDAGPSRYALNLNLRSADVRELTGEFEKEIQGALSASLALEGTVDKPATRRGRGDVFVNGDNMYRIPLVLGLLQITNLSRSPICLCRSPARSRRRPPGT
jgi:hypothetical protein